MPNNLWHHFRIWGEKILWWFFSVIFECFLVVGSQKKRLHVGVSIHCHTDNKKAYYKAAPPTARALKTLEKQKTAIFTELQIDWIFYVYALTWQVYCPLYAFFLPFYSRSAWITVFFFFNMTFTCLRLSPFLCLMRVCHRKQAHTNTDLLCISLCVFVVPALTADSLTVSQ